MRFSRNTNTPDLAQIVNQAFSYKVKDGENAEKTMSMKVEAANISRKGDTKLLVNKSDEHGNSNMQWIDLGTFNIWWQMYGAQALAS